MGLFSGIGKTVTTPLGLAGGLLGGVGGGINTLLSPLGLGGEQGDYYKPGVNPTDQLLGADAAASNAGRYDQRFLKDVLGYADPNGGISYSEMLGKLQRDSGAQTQGLMEGLATNPLSGSKLATDQVMNNDILGRLFAKGGSMDTAAAEEKDLAGRGYQLQPQDREAYGQASGDISRLYGEQENSLANSLAMRGLSNSASLSGAQFSGLQGNKMEQLAKAQTDIADKRMANNLQRLTATRSYLGNLGALGSSSIDQQYNRNLAGINASHTNRNNTIAGMQGNYKTGEVLNNESIDSKKENKGHTLFDALGSGIFSGATSGAAGAAKGAIGGLLGGA